MGPDPENKGKGGHEALIQGKLPTIRQEGPEQTGPQRQQEAPRLSLDLGLLAGSMEMYAFQSPGCGVLAQQPQETNTGRSGFSMPQNRGAGFEPAAPESSALGPSGGDKQAQPWHRGPRPCWGAWGPAGRKGRRLGRSCASSVSSP